MPGQQAAETITFVQRYQILIASGGAIIAALIGFAGVWFAQFKTAKNAREERQHRESMVNRDHKRMEDARRTTLIHALTGELSALCEQSTRAADWFRTQCAIYEVMADEFGQDHEREFPQISLPSFDTILFDSFVSDVGLLPPSITASVAKVYGQYRAMKQVSEKPVLPIKSYIRVLDAFEKSLNELRDATHDLIMRLHAIRLGLDDPGPGKGGEWGATQLSSMGDQLLPDQSKGSLQ